MDAKIPYEDLIAYAAGDLAGPRADAVRRRVEVDAPSARIVQRFRQVVQTLRNDDSVVPPADVIRRAKLIFAERRVAARPGLLDTLSRIVADLVHDSRPQPAFAGVRGAAAAYQLAFESELADVDLEIERHEASGAKLCRIAGQISVRDEATAAKSITFTAAGSGEAAATVAPDSHGAFDAEIAPGVYDLTIDMSGKTVVLACVEIE
jgi:hypothetical protein